jgi:hypothetical protein
VEYRQLRILLWVVIFWIGYFPMSRYKALRGIIACLCVHLELVLTSMIILFELHSQPVGMVWAARVESRCHHALQWLFSAPCTGSASPGIPPDLIDVGAHVCPSPSEESEGDRNGEYRRGLEGTEKLGKFKILRQSS